VALVQAAAGASCPSVTVANLAYPGYTTAQALPVGASRPAGRPASDTARNLEAALALKPVLVLLQFPSNDAAQSFPLSETLANHTTLRDGVRAAGAVDVIIGPFPRAFTDAPTIALMTGLRDGLPAVGAPRYLPLWTDLAKSDNAVLDQYGYGDGIHVNDAGHRLIADKVIDSAAWQAVCTK
jgi:lysophospholipase L1-like esterase